MSWYVASAVVIVLVAINVHQRRRVIELRKSANELTLLNEFSERLQRSETIDEARELWLRGDDEELRALAGAARARWHEPDRATYMVMRIINYTNVCVAQCDYCAFYVLPNQSGGYVLSREDVFAKIDELLAFGGDLVGFNGGFNPKLPLDYYCDLFASVRERYPELVSIFVKPQTEATWRARVAAIRKLGG